MIMGLLKCISTACIAASCYVVGYTLCHVFGDPQTDFFVGMISGIVAVWASVGVNEVIGD